MLVSAKQHYVIAGCVLGLMACAAPAFSQGIVRLNSEPMVTFQPPNANGTTVVAISNSLNVTGYFGGMEPTGFVRDAQGKMTAFVPRGCFRTWPAGVNDGGTIIGYCELLGGFLRDPQGAITWLNCSENIPANPFSINTAGAIVGRCGNNGFIRSPQGAFQTFAPSGSTLTYPFSINDAGLVAGTYDDANNISHGFTRQPNGNISIFELPGHVAPFGQGSPAFRMNAVGAITGTWVDANQINHGFLRYPNGTVTSFDVPGSTSTNALGINSAGTIAGYYADRNNVLHGFIRVAQGSFASFDPAGSTQTRVTAMNDWGVFAGSYNNEPAQFRGGAFIFGIASNEPQPGVHTITNNRGLYVDGGFALYGDATVRLWSYVAGNPAQRWTFSQVTGGFSILNDATLEEMYDAGGTLIERGPSGPPDTWTVSLAGAGYTIKNNRTGLFLLDPGVKNGAILLTPTPSVWQISNPR